MSRKVPGVRIPPAPMGIKEKSFGGDSKRGPADPTGGRRDRGRPRRGALVRAIPPAPMGIKEKSFGGDSKRGPNHLREEKGTEGGPGNFGLICNPLSFIARL